MLVIQAQFKKCDSGNPFSIKTKLFQERLSTISNWNSRAWENVMSKCWINYNWKYHKFLKECKLLLGPKLLIHTYNYKFYNFRYKNCSLAVSRNFTQLKGWQKPSPLRWPTCTSRWSPFLFCFFLGLPLLQLQVRIYV